jgi:ribosome-associated heat shock protein Hsp15
VRIDKLLWFLRLAKSRPLAQALAEEGHIRLNGRRIDRAHQKIAPGDVLTVPIAAGVRVIEVLSLPVRRGPSSEAQACYRTLDAGPAHP